MSELATVKTTKRTKGGGPKTKAGKSTSALNSVRHGIQSKSVLPAELEAYKLHQAAVTASLEPEGYLEERLAERVSLTLWRLTRLEAWESSVLTQRHRKAWESALFQTDTLTILIASLKDTSNLSVRPVSSLSLSETFQELKRLAYGEPDQLLRDWADTALYADMLIQGGEKLTGFYSYRTEKQPIVTDEMLLSLDAEPYDALARALAATVKEWGLSAETICKAILGDAYSPEQAEGYEAGDWEWEVAELPLLWRFYTNEYAQQDDAIDSPHLTAYRVGSEMKRNGERLHELGNRARLLLTEEQDHAVMLSDSEVQKLQRYEAHLERVLYRALHELEAMRERRNGGQAPLARVDVHGTYPD